MHRVLVLLVLAIPACKLVFGLEAAPTCDPGPWHAEIFQTRAVTVELDTRDGCGFPDAETDYRLFIVDPPWRLLEESSLETKHWDAAIERGLGRTTMHLMRETWVIDDLGARSDPTQM